MNNVVIINGNQTAGKDTFVREWRKHSKKEVVNKSTVDDVYEIAKMMGWDGKKDNKSRKFLSDIKKLWTDYNDGIFKKLCIFIDNNPDSEIFIHCREPEEIQKFKDKYDEKCSTLFIKRDIENISENYSDKSVENYNYDIYVDNSGTLEDFKLNIKNLYKSRKFYI
jgi:hypothetical protein